MKKAKNWTPVKFKEITIFVESKDKTSVEFSR